MASPDTAPERGFVEDQPQISLWSSRGKKSQVPRLFDVRQLVEDDTAALRFKAPPGE